MCAVLCMLPFSGTVCRTHIPPLCSFFRPPFSWHVCGADHAELAEQAQALDAVVKRTQAKQAQLLARLTRRAKLLEAMESVRREQESLVNAERAQLEQCTKRMDQAEGVKAKMRDLVQYMADGEDAPSGSGAGSVRARSGPSAQQPSHLKKPRT